MCKVERGFRFFGLRKIDFRKVPREDYDTTDGWVFRNPSKYQNKFTNKFLDG